MLFRSINKAKEELVDIEKRLTLFAEAEAYFIDNAFILPYAVGGGGYSASKLNPFESQYSPFGVASERYKGQKIMDKAMNSEEFSTKLKQWEIDRANALKSSQ